ncbi:Ycf48-like protein precursor [Maioricimonas rarisocia]|uniref:Ycf48-like protein n=1 Tax=Maioricimonas rarisocia TaxID=2528026 RepID=A0A517Z5T1_9PLAN|nr:YCF48-related protein [Maioricimonas rarisocia]QDU37827.1 Ycf48-like protein precursor [Maioricimonas rarisocia]
MLYSHGRERVDRSGQHRHAIICLAMTAVTLGIFCGTVPAQPMRLPATASRSSAPLAVRPAPEQDDATLHDAQRIGSRIAWAVGDHGTIWKSDDGGTSWSLVPTPADCHWTGIAFLTDRVGWICGGSVTPYVKHSQGMVAFTEDGGQSWELRADGTVPYLQDIRFFDLDSGIAIGTATPEIPSGILTTSDGGATWQAVPGPTGAAWKSAAFVDAATGLVGGSGGRLVNVGGGRVLSRQLGSFGLRSIAGLDLASDGTGWLVGDGGLALTTRNGGVAWSPPEGPLPESVRDTFDFRSVSSHGNHVWIAGRPGTAILHSPDRGATWELQPTGAPAPIKHIDFSSETHGIAVGALGRILVTDDGGKTWQATRGENRRLALLAIHAFPQRVSTRLPVRYSGEHGFRTGALITSPDVTNQKTSEHFLQLRTGLIEAGSNDSDILWRLPIQRPDVAHNREQLLAAWDELTDQPLSETYLADLVLALRMWRPDVLVVDAAPEDDAATDLLHQAVEFAVRYAADPTRLPRHAEVGLQAWQVQRAFERLPSGSSGTVEIDPAEVLPRLGTTTARAAEPAQSLVSGQTPGRAGREAYRALEWQQLGDPAAGTARSLFGGLSIAVDSAARRPQRPLVDADIERLHARAQYRRTFDEYAKRMFDDPRKAAQMLAQLEDVLAGATPQDAASQLADLAAQHRRAGHWQFSEDTLTQLVQRYPDQPVALDAMRWLLLSWTSQEVRWQRLQALSADKSTVTIDRDIVQASFAQARSREESLRTGETPGSDVRTGERSPVQVDSVGGQLKIGGQLGQRMHEVDRWQQRAEQTAALLKRHAPTYAATAEIQFPYATLMRHRGKHAVADEVYRTFAMAPGESAWLKAAQGEIWLVGPQAVSPKPVLQCLRSETPPVLDGQLDDACWLAASVVRLTPPPDARGDGETFVGADRLAQESAAGTGAEATVMLSYDNRYLYVAARFPRVPGLPDDLPDLAGRTHDSNQTGLDRLSLQIDVDRDYSTYYRFDVDQRGGTREACWEDEAWNPQWFVAADGTKDEWRIEAAIPLERLVPTPPDARTTWAVGLTRTIPARGIESWQHPASQEPIPAAFGLVRFR